MLSFWSFRNSYKLNKTSFTSNLFKYYVRRQASWPSVLALLLVLSKPKETAKSYVLNAWRLSFIFSWKRDTKTEHTKKGIVKNYRTRTKNKREKEKKEKRENRFKQWTNILSVCKYHTSEVGNTLHQSAKRERESSHLYFKCAKQTRLLQLLKRWWKLIQGSLVLYCFNRV